MLKNKNFKKRIAITLAVIIFCEALIPSKALALTSGPSQPEFSSFQPINATDMVDLFTGDFKYNIPLLNVPGHQGGYPINLFYNSVTNMDEEASMVGLGWNIGIGSISRQVRGIPDDFSGEKIKRYTYLKPQVTVGAEFTPNLEVFGADFAKIFSKNLKLNFTTMYDSYNGLGYGFGIGLKTEKSGFSGSFDITSNSLDGLSYSGGISYKGKLNNPKQGNPTMGNGGISFSANTIDGLIGVNAKLSVEKYNVEANFTDRPTYLPSYELEFTGSNFKISGKGGPELFGAYANAFVSGYYTERKLKKNLTFSPAFGIINSEKGQDNRNALLDYNRINETPIHPKTKTLGVSFPTEDNYICSGHGTGGSFSFKRDDSGTFKDKISFGEASGSTVQIEVGALSVLKLGGEVSNNGSHSISAAHSVETTNHKFRANNESFENGHFRKNNEFTGTIISDVNSHPKASKLNGSQNYLAKDSALVFDINNSNTIFVRPSLADNTYKYKYVNPQSRNFRPNEQIRKNRKPRQSNIIAYSDKDIRRKIPNEQTKIILPYLDVKIKNTTPSSPLTEYTKLKYKNQITAFEEINAEGHRYIYGLPVKNLAKKEVVYAVPKKDDFCNLTTIGVELENGKPNHKMNQPGSDYYYDETETPEFVHSYLLTSILGDNYVDTDPNDGLPNELDKGYWVKFNYLKKEDFKWRIPFLGAQFNPGHHSITSDDKASYSYGEREQYYPESIETNTHIAKFFYAQREDGRGANTEFQPEQGVGYLGAHSYKLVKIELHTKGNPSVIEKTVHFKYVQDTQAGIGLCPGVLNSSNPSKGKLTLASVAIQNYSNERGLLNPYKFEYFPNTNNITYAPNLFDRWGVYKPVPSNNLCQNYYNNYTNQNPNVNNEVKAFHIKSITLPSGAKINVDVGRDHYSHVQDKAATIMIPIKGVTSYGTNEIYKNGNREVHFDSSPGATIGDYIDNLYNDGNGPQVIFKIYSDMLNNGTWEYVTGAAYVDVAASSINTNQNRGILVLKELDLDINASNSYNNHPFLTTAWQFLKINLRNLLTPGNNVEPSTGTKESIIRNFKKLVTVIENFSDLFTGYYSKCYKNNYATKIDLTKSFIRLNEPNQKKYGGGVRVEKITMNNIWDKEGVDISYGNVYIYDTKVKRANGSYYNKSNGVAANEPYLGKEENSLYYMNTIKDDLTFSTDHLSYVMTPGHDAYLPGPEVGYSKVTVRSLPSNDMVNSFNNIPPAYLSQNPDLLVSTTGESVHEFFTAYDFPAVIDNTDLDYRNYKPAWLPIPLVGFIKNNAFTATQGYTCEINDMHGKPKKVSYYAQKKSGDIYKEPISYVEYYYKEKIETYNWGIKKMTRKRLVNEDIDLQVDFEGNNKIFKGELGVDRCLNFDVRLVSNRSGTAGSNGGLNAILALFMPLPFPYIFPNITIQSTTLETGVSNKLTTRKGILDKMIAYDGQSSVETDNLVFDPYTGNPVTTSVTDHFNQKKYNQSYPAYLGYSRMGPAYSNLNIMWDLVPNANNFLYTAIDKCTGYYALSFDNEKLKDILIPGDECIFYRNDITGKANLIKTIGVFQKYSTECCQDVSSLPNHQYLFAIKDPSGLYGSISGNPAFTEGKSTMPIAFKIIRSGNRNLLNTQGQQLVSLSPTTGQSISKVLSATANTYCDFWQYHEQKDSCYLPIQSRMADPIPGECVIAQEPVGFPDQFSTGSKGIFRMEAQYNYVDDRINSNIKEKGIFANAFNLLNWRNSNHNNAPLAQNQWLLSNTVTKRSKSGDVLETKNALNIYNSALYVPVIASQNYNAAVENVVHASIKNSRHLEACFTSFESYELNQDITAGKHNNFDIGLQKYPQFEKFKVLGLEGQSIVIDMLYTEGYLNNFNCDAEVYISDTDTETFSSYNINISDLEASNNYPGFTKIGLAGSLNCDQYNYTEIPDKIIIKKEHLVKQNSLNYEYISNFGHTGKGSLKLTSNVLHIKNQGMLLKNNTDNNNKYYFSAWLYIPENVKSLAHKNITATVNGSNLSFIGNRINGWQQIAGSFYPNNNGIVEINLNKGNANDLYIDDLRMHPFEASMEAYVYDPSTFQLKFTLDDNNFFTKYIYDSEGKLISIQKETERGVKSLQEQRSYLAPNIN
jgi:hypothetical protein